MKKALFRLIIVLLPLILIVSCLSSPSEPRTSSRQSSEDSRTEDSPKKDIEPQTAESIETTTKSNNRGNDDWKATGNLFVSTKTAGLLTVNKKDSYPLEEDGSILLNKIDSGTYSLTIEYNETSVEEKNVEIEPNETARVAFTWENPEKSGDETPNGRKSDEETEQSQKENSEDKIRTVNLLDGKYVGRLKNGKSHGWGTLYLNNGDKYEGEWENGVKNGFGSYFWKNGDVYKGEWKDNKRHGTGTYRTAAGDKYSGSWKNGHMHGYGVYVWSNGDRYEGHWKYGKKEGKGVYESVAGDTYEGQWSNDQMHGEGTFIWSDGDRYEGEWKNGTMHGEGTFSVAYRGRYEGRFKNGKAVGGYYYMPDGTKKWASMNDEGEWKFEELDEVSN